MSKRFDEDLGKLKGSVLAMGEMAESMIRKTIMALIDRNVTLVREVLDDERRMDRCQIEIDNECVKLIGVYTPVASDLRVVLMISRINAELERIGDHAVTICRSYQTLGLLEAPPLKPLVDLPRMAGLAEEMLHSVLKAFVTGSAEESLAVIRSDDEVDRLNDQIFNELLIFMVKDSQSAQQALGLLLTARGFERIADHAVNIAEDVVYIVRGEDIRHTK